MNTISKTLLVLSMTLGLGACHPDDGAMNGAVDAGAKGGHGGAVTGGQGGAAASGPAAFLGTWQYPKGTGTTTVSCDDGTVFDVVTDGTERETFTAGNQPSEVIATDGFGCTATCVVSGNKATCFASQPCDGVMLTTDTYEVVGSELHETALGTVSLDDGTLCDFTSAQNVLVRLP